jgi:hypothetical protein
MQTLPYDAVCVCGWEESTPAPSQPWVSYHVCVHAERKQDAAQRGPLVWAPSGALLAPVYSSNRLRCCNVLHEHPWGVEAAACALLVLGWRVADKAWFNGALGLSS